ncbi:uncharacterized protein DUF4835 [Mucilaginibacter gracilis]|uniref:Uncharacterized protein DUF4835 n=1 Tax=Mucilaginibacter gracilis TaxID=423350 RepID=A0A495J0F7_9SPHI|nr:DUF4835 family protein [Mucilaginibacter gracilis]RKR81579.1 uncharacterized protein DUF4835 [Mucilaginibacter gracilis]
MKKLAACIITLLCLTNLVNGQDLNAHVQVLTPKIQTSNKRVFQVLENAMKDFMNNRKWCADQVLPQERIECNLVLNITAWDGSSKFSGELQVQSTRPIFGSTYTSALLSINDKDFDFVYTEGQQLDFNEQNFQSNLTSVLGFYANIIVGMDYDSFSKFGGSLYFAKAQTIVTAAQSASYKGWNAFDNNRNRYWLAENLNNKRYTILREFNYNYHRLGLDTMADNAINARKTIADLLSDLEQLDRQGLGAMLPLIFFSTKSDEFVSILSAADPQTRIRAYNILNQADPSNGNKYAALQKN